MLGVLGLGEIEERAYRRLVGVPSESVAGLARELRVDVPVAAAALRSLEAAGLVARSVAEPGQYVASPPGLALGSLIVQRQEDIRRAEVELAGLVEAYRAGASERMLTDVIDVVSGPQAVAQRFGQLQRGARHEVLALIRSTVALVSPEDNVDEDVALGRGVQYRLVVERAALERPGYVEVVRDSIAMGEDIRVRESVPMRLLVVDRQLALVPLLSSGDDQGGGALLVHPSGLLDALVGLFELLWSDALPALPPAGSPADGSGVDDTDRDVLALLLHGLTDQAIGGQLDMSLRTVQRRVQQLMARAGVTTRFQLGHAATVRGWVS